MKIKKWLNKILLYTYKNKYIYKESLILLSNVLKKNLLWIYLNLDYILVEKKLIFLNLYFIKRLRGEPIWYILNKCFFYKIYYKIYPDVFIPRIGTEIMLNYLLNLIKKYKLFNILELGFGSGGISLNIAKKYKNSFIWAVDKDDLILNLLKYNCNFLNIKNIIIYKSNWFDNINSSKLNFFDLIVCNPPYLWSKDNCLNKGDLRYENYTSLVSSSKGLLDIIYIIKKSFFYLKINGFLIIEHSLLNLEKIVLNFKKYFYFVKTYKGLNYNYRFTIGKKLI